jgi:hypothetical protein
MQLWSGYSNCAGGECDAVIWAEQQLVAIPGWLLEYQNARLDQEGQLAPKKEPRSLVFKKNKNKAKRRTIYWEERGNKMATLSIPPPLPVATLGPGPTSFQKDLRICGKSGRFEKKVVAFRKRWLI